LPDDIDPLRAALLDLYLLVNNQNQEIGTAQLQIDIDCVTDQEEMGISYPANGFSETVYTNDFTIVEPIGLNNMRMIHIAVPLNSQLLFKNSLCDIIIQRIVPLDETMEYNGALYLSVISLRYYKK